MHVRMSFVHCNINYDDKPLCGEVGAVNLKNLNINYDDKPLCRKIIIISRSPMIS